MLSIAIRAGEITYSTLRRVSGGRVVEIACQTDAIGDTDLLTVVPESPEILTADELTCLADVKHSSLNSEKLAEVSLPIFAS